MTSLAPVRHSHEVNQDPEEGLPEPPQECECSFIEIICMTFSVFFLIVFFPLAICFYKKTYDYQRMVVFRFGKMRSGGPLGPGYVYVIPCIDDIHIFDMRTISYDVPRQKILSNDALSIDVDAVVYYRIVDPTLAISKVKTIDYAIQLLSQTALRNVLGTQTLTDILSHRDTIGPAIQVVMAESTKAWGVMIERIEIKDVSLPAEMQRAMAAEAEATREANAKVIAAEGEKQASQALAQASAIMDKSPGSLQLRYLQTLNAIAAEKNSTIIFPLPMELLAAFSGRH